MHIVKWDDRREIAILENQKTCLDFCAEHFLKAYEEALVKHGSFSVALSGGSTPKALFMLLTSSSYKQKIDWSKVYLFWSDERSVPPNDPDSNFYMAMQAGFSSMPIPQNHIHRMKAEENIEENALSYEQALRNHLQGRGLDLVMLGMGEDGHTASLFPKTEALKAKDRWVVANHVPQKNTWRMTFTYACINKASHIAIYVLGESKQEMLRLALQSKEGLYPIENVGTIDHKALWIVDEAASKLLTSEL